MTTTKTTTKTTTTIYPACILLAVFIASSISTSIVQEAKAFSSSSTVTVRPTQQNRIRGYCYSGPLFANDENKDDENENELPDFDLGDEGTDSEKTKSESEKAADRWKQQAKELREQISKMEEELPEKPVDPERAAALKAAQEAAAAAAKPKEPVSLLDGKNILLVGANGRLGSMVCRRLLREFPEIKNVVAMVHVVGENSETSRGFGRLAYEVGAEDGRGSIGPAWSAEERTATFEFDEEVMKPYHLEKLRIVECEVRKKTSSSYYRSGECLCLCMKLKMVRQNAL